MALFLVTLVVLVVVPDGDMVHCGISQVDFLCERWLKSGSRFALAEKAGNLKV
jgi:hypothetical protein